MPPSKSSSIPFGLRVGLLGGGQLARMLVLKGHEMGLTMKVLCKSPADPAAQVTPHVTLGDPDLAADVTAFARTVDVVTLESEFHAGAMLEQAHVSSRTPFHPSPAAIARLQDRLPQKELLVRHGLPTAPFLAVGSAADVESARAKFPRGFVLKKRQHGYDGYGTFIVRTEKDLAQARAFDVRGTPFIAEGFVKFKRELAVQAARGVDGRVVFFPMVETKQVDRRLDSLTGPVSHRGLPALKTKIAKFLRALDYVGVIAFELFETPQGLLVNEIAPRVHNSGHASLEALSVDQFTQHLRAVCGLRLHEPRVLGRGFAMVNLIGDGGAAASPTGLQGHLHWYGKTENRKGRKMGHLTVAGVDPRAGLRLALKERKGFKG